MKRRKEDEKLLEASRELMAGYVFMAVFALGVILQMQGYLVGIGPTISICAMGTLSLILTTVNFVRVQHAGGSQSTLPHMVAMLLMIILVSLYVGYTL